MQVVWSSMFGVRTVLFDFAHPDDELAVGPGTIAEFVKRGVRVVLYYATLGEGGISGYLKAGNEMISPEDLAKVRFGELNHSAEILGVSRTIVRDFKDGMLNSQIHALKKDILDVLEEENPDIVFTFPPSGITGHSDHQAVSLATEMALMDYPGNVRLYHRIITDHQGVVNVEHDPIPVTFTVDVVPHQEKILSVMRAHASQVHSMVYIFPALEEEDGGVERVWQFESFALVTLK